MNNILIGLSWPYANGELHIGHLGSSLPADILARYYRLKGDNVCFVSGSDCFGTPISIEAQKNRIKPSEIAENYHEKFVQVFKDLNFSFDNYTKTNSEHHINFAKAFHKKIYNTEYVYKKDQSRLYCNTCNRFLPDRYVIGNCPNCGSISKGDACEKCGTILEPEDLKNPKCGICNNVPTFKDNFQYYISLTKLEEKLKKYFENKKSGWSINAINLTERYFQEGLIDRAITRELDWGVPVPVEGLEEKVIYNWGENVLGYISACKEYCEKTSKNFSDWFNNDKSKHIYVHAKDNIQFHTIIFPALLLANGYYHLPDNIYAYEFVTNEGQKISKSKGTALTAKQLLEKYDVDFLRFYFAKNISDKKDLDFSKKEFVNAVNGELINNFGNFVNRTLSFIKSKLGGRVGKSTISQEVKEKIIDTYKNVSINFENGKVSNAVKYILDLVDYSNKYFDTTEPWKVVKTDLENTNRLCYDYLNLIVNICILFNPIIPDGTSKVFDWLNTKPKVFDYQEIENIELKNFQPLYKRIEE